MKSSRKGLLGLLRNHFAFLRKLNTDCPSICRIDATLDQLVSLKSFQQLCDCWGRHMQMLANLRYLYFMRIGLHASFYTKHYANFARCTAFNRALMPLGLLKLHK